MFHLFLNMNQFEICAHLHCLVSPPMLQKNKQKTRGIKRSFVLAMFTHRGSLVMYLIKQPFAEVIITNCVLAESRQPFTITSSRCASHRRPPSLDVRNSDCPASIGQRAARICTPGDGPAQAETLYSCNSTCWMLFCV